MEKKTEFDLKIEKLLYFKNGFLSIKEYLDIISDSRIIWIKFEGDFFTVKTDTNNEFKFKVYKPKKM